MSISPSTSKKILEWCCFNVHKYLLCSNSTKSYIKFLQVMQLNPDVTAGFEEGNFPKIRDVLDASPGNIVKSAVCSVKSE